MVERVNRRMPEDKAWHAMIVVKNNCKSSSIGGPVMAKSSSAMAAPRESEHSVAVSVISLICDTSKCHSAHATSASQFCSDWLAPAPVRMPGAVAREIFSSLPVPGTRQCHGSGWHCCSLIISGRHNCNWWYPYQLRAAAVSLWSIGASFFVQGNLNLQSSLHQ
jgi:hypothetical protein